MSASGGSRAFRFHNKLERKIVHRVGAAIADFQLIAEGDHVLVAVSGGKDSLSLLEVLAVLAKRSPVRFEMTAVTIHPGRATFSTQWIEEHCRRAGYRHRVEPVPIEEIVQEKLEPGTTPCALCSRIRRGALYTLAPRLGCNKIALGHHLDDLVETLLLNFFFGGQLRSMAPLLRSNDGRNIVIRPLCYVPEAWLAAYSQQRGFQTINCVTEGCDVADGQRAMVKALLARLTAQHPSMHGNMLRALRRVRVEHLLDRALLRLIGR